MRLRTKPLGVILYEGPSLIDGQSIAVIATGFQRPTANTKTGNMLQTWIVRADVNPLEAIHTGQDVSICGDCPLRGMLETRQRRTVNRRRACYVNVHQAPLAVYHAYRRGRYEPFDSAQHLALFQGRMLRLGSYGDPVAAPLRVWAPLVRVASGRTGYTHQWRDGRFWRYRAFLMASVETLDDARASAGAGGAHSAAPQRGRFQRVANSIVRPAQRRDIVSRVSSAGHAMAPTGNQVAHRSLIWAHGSPATLGSYSRIWTTDRTTPIQRTPLHGQDDSYYRPDLRSL